ncbi:unnamed protein product [Aspergillus oryzae]|uniref:Unnamed protein product n=2 Tax=Aspergillus oryzae TaxID=5062 RepID=A0AAN5BZJ0_ASPOZ|nr:unnamed protein product [Aspergillus oryzae]GMF92007.1 unnamed protein product [Aspergillus oryzae]GMG33173.1 unnamed protein product [Aspergillus oryzae]GMG53150.1 unnamed protein product [Aspergillus oryzae var. brunneus]
MAALWMARCGVKTRIIDARATKVFRGHADGMQTGTLEIFDSFGIRALLDGMKAFDGLEVERGVLATAINIDEAGIHDPKAHAIKLTVRHLTDKELAAASTPDTIPQPGDFNYNSADEPYLKRKVAGKEGRTEVIHARFVIGADGSRSWTRSALGFDFLGDDGEEDVGGILDCIATSNFRK